MRPLVSVAIPVYNAEALVGSAVESVLGQTYGDLELVIVDDASTDATWDAVQAFRNEARVRLHRNPVNLGMVGNWDRAFDLTTGPYVKLLCADDALYPTCLARQVEALEGDDSVVIASCRRDIVDDLDRLLLKDWGLRGLHGTVDGSVALRRSVRSGTNQIGEPSAALLRREAVEAAGGWASPVRYLTDLDLWWRLLRRGSLFALDETLCVFRVWPGSLSTSGASEQARQLRQFFLRLHDEDPEIASRTDVALGSVRARLLQPLRRYVFWKAGRRRGR